jgi:hypothetical protein
MAATIKVAMAIANTVRMDRSPFYETAPAALAGPNLIQSRNLSQRNAACRRSPQIGRVHNCRPYPPYEVIARRAIHGTNDKARGAARPLATVHLFGRRKLKTMPPRFRVSKPSVLYGRPSHWVNLLGDDRMGHLPWRLDVSAGILQVRSHPKSAPARRHRLPADKCIAKRNTDVSAAGSLCSSSQTK